MTHAVSPYCPPGIVEMARFYTSGSSRPPGGVASSGPGCPFTAANEVSRSMPTLSQNLKEVLPTPLFLSLKAVRAGARLELRKAITRFRSNHRIFNEIYRINEWGGRSGEFYSGSGSYEPPVEEYAAVVRDFIRENDIDSIVALGCGDFNVGKRIVGSGLQYIGIDVVRPLIDRNNQLFGTRDISFECLDIVKDDLPNGKLCKIRQVFQHL